MKPSFFKRVKRAVRLEFRRIRDEHRSTGRRHKKPPLSVRIRHHLKELKPDNHEFRRAGDEAHRSRKRRKKPPVSIRFRRWLSQVKLWGSDLGRKKSSKPHIPPLSKRIKYYFQRQQKQYAVVFSGKYLTITLNSTILYLLSFFLVHFLTHLVTAITAWFCDISTTLNYTVVDFHIRYWNWTPEMVILVFSVPAIFALLIAVLTSLAFAGTFRKPRFLWRFRFLTKKQRYKHRQKQRNKELEAQVQRINKTAPPEEKPKRKKRISWTIRLFLLWTFYHSITFFFSGMLYSFLFHRRFGYVIWYAFNAYIFDLLASVVAFLSMVIIGYVFAVQFFNSGRMYFNDLNDRNRMSFVLSQAIFPFIIGTILTIALQFPTFDPALILLNFSLFFLILPLPSRAAHYDSLHFDSREKTVKIYWNWLLWSLVIIISIIIAIKIGITIRLP